LDARVRKELRGWLRRLHDDVHVTTVLVTHDQEEAMDVADRIVVMNEGQIEQTGKPRDLYEHPSTEFVMSFVGPVNRLDNGFVRPHDLAVQLEPDSAARTATVERIVHLGFEVRVEMALDGTKVSSQVTREEAERLELRPGQQVYVQASNRRSFG
jgi:sulfate transport system ATP-binding protein